MDENSVGRNDDFYLLGGDSIKSMMVMLTAGVDGLSAKDIFKNKTARRISEAISTRKRENIAEFEFQARQKAIPATAAQIQMIDYQFLNVNSTMYNLSGFYRLDAKSNAEKRLGFSRNVISIAAAVLAMRDYCQKSFIRVDFLNSNRVDEYIQDTVGLIFKILPVAVNLDDFPSNERLLQEISRQVAESFANRLCDYSSEDNIALRDALLVNYVADLGDSSLLKGFEPTEIPLTSEKPAVASHVDIYLMENNGAVNIAFEYQRKAYSDGSVKRFLTLFVEHWKHFIGEN